MTLRVDKADKVILCAVLWAVLLGAAGDWIVGGWQVYSRVAWDDLRFPANRLFIGAANPPDYAQWRTDGAGSDGVYALEFEDQAVNEEQVWGDAQFPHSWKEESTISPHSHWSLEDDTSCNVRFCIEYMVSMVAGDWPANTTAAHCGDCASGGDTDNHNLCDLGDISMTGITGVSPMLKFRLYRNSTHANDTCNSKDAWLHEFDIHYQKDTRGSRLETSK